MKSNKKNKSEKGAFIFRVLGLLVSLGLVYYLVDDPSLIWDNMRKLNVSMILAGWILVMLAHVFVAIRWRTLVLKKDLRGGWFVYFRWVMMSCAFRLFLPGSFAADMSRVALDASTRKQGRARVAWAVLSDKIIGLIVATTIGCVALMFDETMPQGATYVLLLGLVFILGGLLSGLLLAPVVLKGMKKYFCRFQDKMDTLISVAESWTHVYESYKKHPQQALYAFGLSIVVHFLMFFAIRIIALDLGLPISLLTLCIVMPIMWVAVSIPISIGGLGIREVSLIYLLSLYGIPTEDAVSLSLGILMLNVLLSVSGLFFVWFNKKRPTNQINPSMVEK